MSESSAPRKRAQGGGRKPTDPATHIIKKSVSLSPDVYDHLLLVGNKKLSKGIRIVAEFHQEAQKTKS